LNAASTEDDIAFMRDIGWIESKEEEQALLNERYGHAKARGESDDNQGEETGTGVKGPNRHGNARSTLAFDYSAAGTVGVMPAKVYNPFFTDAALTGGPLAQSFGKPAEAKQQKKQGKQHRRQERPERKDGRTHAYRKKS
jgi:hypothetical protein